MSSVRLWNTRSIYKFNCTFILEQQSKNEVFKKYSIQKRRKYLRNLTKKYKTILWKLQIIVERNTKLSK